MTTEIVKAKDTRTIKEYLTGEEFAEEVAKVATKYMTPERMIRVAETTLKRVPKLEQCTPETVFVALLNCSAAGLEPDGQHAHLVPYNNECKLIFDWKGLLAIARRHGVHCTTKIVCKNDVFICEEDDGFGRTKLKHEVDYTKPRGDMYAVYSRATWSQEGQSYLDYEIMPKEEVDKVRKSSKAGQSGPWKDWYNEMARKTVIRRHSKRWPLTAEVYHAINSDDDTPDFEKRFKGAKQIKDQSPIFQKPDEQPDEVPMTDEG